VFKPFIVKTVPQECQRYGTCGDWTDHFICVTDENNPRAEKLVALHEIFEKFWCEEHGVKEEDVLAFDLAYEASRGCSDVAPCGCKHYDEPGDDPHACYYIGHQLATVAEHMLASTYANFNWIKYNNGEPE
jgi:hypothetical protein